MHDMLRLVEPLIPALRRYARSLLKDRTAADDLVQDCLERVISRWHQRRGGEDTRSWVFAILHNLAVSRLRQRARRGSHIAFESLEDAELGAGHLDDGMRQREVLRALDALPEEQRAVILLVSVEDLSYAEAAQVLDIPMGTVMSRIARARDKLTKLMDGDVRSAAERPNLRRIK